MKRRNITLISILLILSLLFSLTSCTFVKADVVDLMDGVTPADIEASPVSDSFIAGQADFAAELFKNSFDGESNTLISPLSVSLALALAANGADGGTRTEFEALFGDIPLDKLNSYFLAYTSSLTSGEKYKLGLANSIWIKNTDVFTVKKDFLQTNADYYGADAYKIDFNSGAVKEINNWVSENTDGMIEKMVDSIDPLTVMILLNTVLFDAEWQSIYYEHNLKDGTFTTEDGKERDVTMMHSTERTYIETNNATGFIKNYSGGKYSFAALLPNEGVTVSELAESLSGEKLIQILNSPCHDYKVVTRLPEFEYDYNIVMNDILAAMGLEDAFSAKDANFTGIADEAEALRFYISDVIHKTNILVGAQGTKAAAATKVEMRAQGSAAPSKVEIKHVYLDRPFMYMIIDNDTNLPIFIGAVTDIGK